MRTRFRTSLFGGVLGLSVFIGTGGPAWAQEQQTPQPTTPMSVSSVTVEGGMVRIVGVDANGGPLVLLLDMRQMTPDQLQALGLPACPVVSAASCIADAQAMGTSGSQATSVGAVTGPGFRDRPGCRPGWRRGRRRRPGWPRDRRWFHR